MNWTYQNMQIKTLADTPVNSIGFIYEVEHLATSYKYIGKKILYHKRKVKLGKKELANLDKRKKKYKIVTKESDWKSYVGSNDIMQMLLKQGSLNDFKRKIIMFCYTKKQMAYWEMYFQFKYDVLSDLTYTNENINGKFFAKDI